jgi:50S ribosomal protein L16 3-hydroxylase
MYDFDLSHLLGPLHADAFLTEYWPARHHWSHGPVARFGALCDVPELFDLERLLAVYRDHVQVYFPSQPGASPSAAIVVQPEQALAMYERGGRLQFNAVHEHLPAVARYLRGLEQALGIGARTSSCGLFATPGGGVVLPHFDTDPAFSLQLVGRKRWHFGLTPPVRNVLQNHVYGAASPYIAQYHAQALPTAMPEDAIELVMDPGSVLYLPRGLPHTTVSDDPTMSITLELPLPTFVDVLTEALRERVSRIEACRGFVLLGTEQQRRHSHTMLAELRPQIDAVFEELTATPAALFDVVESRIMPDAEYSYERDADAHIELSSSQVRVTHAKLGVSEVEVPHPLMPLCRWIHDRGQAFEDRQALAAVPDVLDVDVMQVLSVFVECGALTRREHAAGGVR